MSESPGYWRVVTCPVRCQWRRSLERPVRIASGASTDCSPEGSISSNSGSKQVLHVWWACEYRRQSPTFWNVPASRKAPTLDTRPRRKYREHSLSCNFSRSHLEVCPDNENLLASTRQTPKDAAETYQFTRLIVPRLYRRQIAVCKILSITFTLALFSRFCCCRLGPRFCGLFSQHRPLSEGVSDAQRRRY